MAWIAKRSGKYLVEWREADGRKRSATRRTLAEARILKAEVETGLASGAYTSSDYRKTSFGVYALDIIETNLRLGEATRDTQLRFFRKHVEARIGRIPLGKVDDVVLVRLFRDLQHDEVGVPTLNTVRRILSTVFNTALKRGHIVRNPLLTVSVPREVRRDIMVLEPDAVERLADAVPPRYRAMVVLAAWSGLRVGELGALRVADVDFLRRRVSVTQAVTTPSTGPRIKEPKTKASRRTVPVPSFALEQVAAHIVQFPPTDDGLIFKTERGDIVHHGNIHPWFARARKRASLDGFRFHDLRHCFASTLIRQGANPKVIATLMGHTTVAMSFDRYGHLFDQDTDNLVARIEEAHRQVG